MITGRYMKSMTFALIGEGWGFLVIFIILFYLSWHHPWFHNPVFCRTPILLCTHWQLLRHVVLGDRFHAHVSVHLWRLPRTCPHWNTLKRNPRAWPNMNVPQSSLPFLCGSARTYLNLASPLDSPDLSQSPRLTWLNQSPGLTWLKPVP